MSAWKLSMRARCQPGGSGAAKSGAVGRLPRPPMGGRGDAVVEEAVVDEVEVLGHVLEVLSDLLAERVAVRGDVPELLEHRHVLVRLHVAHHAGVPVPVPGATDPAGLVDDPDALEA